MKRGKGSEVEGKRDYNQKEEERGRVMEGKAKIKQEKQEESSRGRKE